MKFLLNYSFFYKLFGFLIGGNKCNWVFARDYIKSDGSKRILDLCCGPCGILPLLEFKEYVGVDFSDKYISHCKTKYAKLKNASFILEDAGSFLDKAPPSDGEKFDIVLFLGGMHHIEDTALTGILQNVQKWLAPGGRLVTLDGCFEPGLSWVTRKILANDRGKFVRTKEAWVEMFTSVFKDYEYVTRKDLLRIPYNHIIFYK